MSTQPENQPYPEHSEQQPDYDPKTLHGQRTLGYVRPKTGLERESTLNLSLPDWLVPAELADQAAAWNRIEDQLDAAEFELALARGEVAGAPSADKQARKAALAAGKPFKGTPAQDKAASRLREAEDNMRALNELSREIGNKLIKSLRNARADVVHLTAERLAPAIDAARQAADAAQEALKTVTEEVSEAATGLTLIASLDANDIDFTGATIVDIPKPNLSPLRQTLATLESDLGTIDTPAKPQLLRVEVNGIISDHIKPESAKMLIENFGGREVPIYDGVSGLPETRKPINGDSFDIDKKRHL